MRLYMGMGEKCVMTFGERCFLCHLFFFFFLFDTLWSCLTKFFNIFFCFTGRPAPRGSRFTVNVMEWGWNLQTKQWIHILRLDGIKGQWYEFYRGISVLLHLETSQQTYLGVNCVLLWLFLSFKHSHRRGAQLYRSLQRGRILLGL